MSFEIALQYLKQGYIIRRAGGRDTFAIIDDEIKRIISSGYTTFAGLDSEDILASDWGLVL